MKKGIIVLLIAVLVSGFAFASLTGNAGIIYEAAFDKDNFAFITENKKSLSFSFTFASESVEIAGDEDVHVEVAASAKFILGSRVDGGKGIFIDDGTVDEGNGIGAVIKLDTAKIVGKNWYVDVTGTQDAYDYAKAAVLTIKSKEVKDDFGNFKKLDNQAASYVSSYDAIDGVTVGFNGFTFSGGVDYLKLSDALSVHAGSATIETPEFAFNDDAVKVQAAAELSRGVLTIPTTQVKIAATAVGASAKATVAIQDITVGAAVDMGLDYMGAEDGIATDKETQFNVDARVDFKYNFVDASIYTYAGKAGLEFGDGFKYYKDFYLEAKAAFDLNAFELPLKVTVSAKNITNAEVETLLLAPVKGGIDPSIKVEFAKDAITAAASFGINTESKVWKALAYGTYAFEKFTAGAGVYLNGASEMKSVGFGAFAESDKLVNGAKFGLAYGLSPADVYSDGAAACIADADLYTSDFKADPAAMGSVAAYCKITF